MEKIIMLGTGNAQALQCYNTCFAIQDDDEYFLVDAGGGNGILLQLQKANIPLESIHHIFLTHEHTDHLLGMIWMLRMIATSMNKGKYHGDLYFYAHSDLVDTVRTIAKLTLTKKFTRLFDQKIHFIRLYDGDQKRILDYDVRFFDILSTKAKQFGFTMTFRNGEKLICAGDEPLNEQQFHQADGATWMMHEAFCLYSMRDIFDPYEKHHSTVKEASELAQALGVPKLILYHTEDKHLANRKVLYTAEGRLYYHGELYVPDDLDEFLISE